MKIVQTSMVVVGLMTAAPAAALAAGEKVTLDLYVMSMCPYGVQAENGLFPAVKSLGRSVELNLHFIAGELPAVAASAETKPAFSSLHGQPEVDENIRQACMMKHYPQSYMDYILERNKAIKNPNWQAAVVAAGGDAVKIEACMSGPEGAALHSVNIKAANGKNIGSSPTIFIEDKPYTGGRSVRAFTLALCDAMQVRKLPLPEACQKAQLLPADPADKAAGGCDADGNPVAKAEPVAFDIRVVADKACKFCEPTLLAGLKARHPAADIKVLDVKSPEGNALVVKHMATTLPLYVLDNKVEKEGNFQSLQNSFYAKSAGQYIVRPVKEAFIPSVHLGRAVRAKHLDIFVSPLSPFAVEAEAELTRFLTQSDIKDLTFTMHFIVKESVKADEKAPAEAADKGARSASLKELSSVSSELSSLNGAAELRESLRQICLFQYSSIGNYFTYLACRSSNIQDERGANFCLKAGDAVKKCMEGTEGYELLLKDARLVKELGINTSIALLWENRYGPFGWHDVDWKALVSGK